MSVSKEPPDPPGELSAPVESHGMKAMRGAFQLSQIGCIDEAMAISRWVIEHEPDNPIAWNNLGHGHWKQGRIRQSMHAYNRALELWPEYPEAWNNKGVCLSDLGRLNRALECQTRAVALGPDGWIRVSNKASTLEHLGRLDEALHCYHRLRFLAPDLETWRAAYRYTRRTYNSAVAALRRAKEDVAARPLDAEAWCEIGWELQQLARLDPALACYDRALELDRAHDGSWMYRGMVLLRMQRPDQALASLDRSIELSRSTEGGEHWGAWHQKGLCLGVLGNPEAAIDCHARTLELHASHSTAWFDKAVLEDDLGRIGEAKVSYQRCTEQKWWAYIGQKEWAQERLAELG